MKKAHKAYYLTCCLLSMFQERGGFNSMIADKEMFEDCYRLVHGKTTEKEFLDGIETVFGLEKKDLKNALKTNGHNMKNTCLRCGVDREDKPYGVCALYGTVEKRHIWGEFKGETETIELNDLLTTKDK